MDKRVFALPSAEDQLTESNNHSPFNLFHNGSTKQQQF